MHIDRKLSCPSVKLGSRRYYRVLHGVLQQQNKRCSHSASTVILFTRRQQENAFKRPVCFTFCCQVSSSVFLCRRHQKKQKKPKRVSLQSDVVAADWVEFCICVYFGPDLSFFASLALWILCVWFSLHVFEVQNIIYHLTDNRKFSLISSSFSQQRLCFHISLRILLNSGWLFVLVTVWTSNWPFLSFHLHMQHLKAALWVSASFCSCFIHFSCLKVLT